MSIENIKSCEFISLCQVLRPNKKGNIWIRRLADFDQKKKELKQFVQDPSKPDTYENRSRSFWSNGENYNSIKYPEGWVGVWKWNAKPNKTNSSTDYTNSSLCDDIEPIEVIEVIGTSETRNLDKVIEKLREGCRFSSPPQFKQFLLCAENREDSEIEFECLLFNLNNIQRNSDLYKIIPEGLSKVPCYTIYKDEFLTFEKRKFFKCINIEDEYEVKRYYPIVEPMENVKKIIIEQFPWRIGKNLGLTKRNWQSLKSTIEGLPPCGIYDKIAERCECGHEEAKKYFEKYVSCLEEYVDLSLFSDDVYHCILENNPNIRKKCLELWENKYAFEKDTKLQKFEENIRCKKNELEKLEETNINLDDENKKLKEIQKKLESELESLKAKLDNSTRNAVQVEQKLAARIESAKQNVADFMAEMAFITTIVAQSKQNLNAKESLLLESEVCREHDEINQFQEFVVQLGSNLSKNGVKKDYAKQLGICLYAAYLLKQAILLAGPSAQLIANVFSMTLFAREAALLNCYGEPSAEVHSQLETCESEVIAVRQALQSKWINEIADMSMKRKKFMIICHPFVEDLVLEPKSLYTYILPIRTDCLTEDKSLEEDGIKNIEPSKFEFIEPEQLNTNTERSKLFKQIKSQLKVNSYALSVLKNNLDKFCNLMKLGNKPVTNFDPESLLFLFPYLYATEMLDTIKEKFDIFEFSTETKKIFESFYGEIE